MDHKPARVPEIASPGDGSADYNARRKPGNEARHLAALPIQTQPGAEREIPQSTEFKSRPAPLRRHERQPPLRLPSLAWSGSDNS